ncbi:MAG: hypothetical protein K8T10_06110 [Candidatus Eremiobacteraeota bacterium]|nr:hypothetical protein [Candidatus Eremiobacteraeota bacterium]
MSEKHNISNHSKYIRRLLTISLIISGYLLISLFSSSTIYGIDNSSDYCLGKLKIGQNGDILEDFGMPIPIEEGGYHTLYNKKENVCLRVSLDFTKEKKRHIKSIRLSHKDIFVDKVRLNDQLLLTGVSLIKMKTGKGIGLGTTEKEVIKKYGNPDYRKSYGKIRELIYMKNSGEEGIYMSFVIKEGRVVGISMGTN